MKGWVGFMFCPRKARKARKLKDKNGDVFLVDFVFFVDIILLTP